MTGPAGVLRQVTPSAGVVLAPNPGPDDARRHQQLGAAGAGRGAAAWWSTRGRCDEGHLAVLAGCGPVAVVLLTHGHADHSEGAAPVRRAGRRPVRALDPAHRLGDEGLGEGDVVAAAGLELRVLATPGHTADSLSFVLERTRCSPATPCSAAAPPSSRTRTACSATTCARWSGCARSADRTVLPGHGPELPSAGEAAERYLAHREQRLAQVRAAVARGRDHPAGRRRAGLRRRRPRRCGRPPSCPYAPSSPTCEAQP